MPKVIEFNSACIDDYPRTTLGELRGRVLRRLGFASSLNQIGPGYKELVDDFIRDAQEILFIRMDLARMTRLFSWAVVPDVRYYDLKANQDACVKKLSPDRIEWVGYTESIPTAQSTQAWSTLEHGIPAELYSSETTGRPLRYEVRQGIEIWPTPSVAGSLVIRGQFGLLPLIDNNDETTVDPQAIFLLAIANAKAHLTQPDANNYVSQLETYIAFQLAQQHRTQRYLPGERASGIPFGPNLDDPIALGLP